MRTLIVTSVLALSVVWVGHGQAQQSGKNSMIIAPNIPRTLTISRADIVLTTLNIPQGTIISITFDTGENGQPAAGDGRFSFHGNVEIHVEAASQRTAKLFDSMDQAPIHLTAIGVDVAIAPR
jgi:hypothetical protein